MPLNQPRNILILGATSGIARGIANAFAKKGDKLYLAGRDEFEIERIAQDLRVRYGVTVTSIKFDIENYATLPEVPHLDGVVFAMGYMGKDIKKTLKINFTEAVHVLNHYADILTQHKKGFIVGISSVAGDRGRQSNFIYGSAKAGLTTYLSGLRNKLAKTGVKIITIKPGFIDTAMTFGLPGMFLVADPNKIGQKIAHSVDKSAKELYLPWFWKYIMGIIKSIPEFIFKRMSL